VYQRVHGITAFNFNGLSKSRSCHAKPANNANQIAARYHSHHRLKSFAVSIQPQNTFKKTAGDAICLQ
jgi:hypothetical protein